ncbi:MAG: hypothetical protein ABSH26_07145 [Opitutaceae bacterium]|jgi:hypothetical protein
MKISRVLFVSTAAACSALFFGCDTVDSRIRGDPAAFARLNPQEQAMVKAGQVGLGFSAEAVKMALGEPNRVTVRTDERGQVQIWHYIETVFYDGAFLYGGPYWGGWGGWGGWGRRGWGWGGYWGGPYPVGPVSTYDRFLVELRDNKVISFSQEIVH